MNRTFLVATLIATLCNSTNLLAQVVGQAPSPSSGEVMEPTPFTFLDTKFNCAVSVFQSAVGLATPGANDNVTNIQFYLSPLCSLIPIDANGKLYSKETIGNKVRFSFNMIYYYDDMFKQASARLKSLYDKDIAANRISLMAISVLTTSVKGVNDVAPYSKGSAGKRLALPASEIIFFDVDKSMEETFERLVNSTGGLTFETTIVYNAIKLQLELLSWSAEDVKSTEAYKNIDSGGAAYVTAEQMQTVIQEIGRKINVFKYKDPNASNQIDDVAKDTFNKMLASAPELLLNNQQQAEAIDKELRKASGLTAENYQPVTLNYKYHQEVFAEDDVSAAQEKAKSFYFREQTNLSASAKGSYGPFSGKASYNRTTDKVESEYFKDQNSYKAYKSSARKEEGGGVRFVPRGLKLVDKGHFKNQIQFTANSVSVTPYSSVGQLLVSPSTASIKPKFLEYTKALDELKIKLDEAQAAVASTPKRFKIASKAVAFYRPEDRANCKAYVAGFNGEPYFENSVTKFEIPANEVYTGIIGAPPGTKYIMGWFTPKSAPFNQGWHEADFRQGEDSLKFAGMTTANANFVFGHAIVLYYE
jgi:hypothetical protein